MNENEEPGLAPIASDNVERLLKEVERLKEGYKKLDEGPEDFCKNMLRGMTWQEAIEL